MKTRTLSILCLILITGCTFYPKYERPCADIPEQWRSSADEASTAANERWWESLGDCALNELIRETLQNNNDLRIATARIAQFQAQLGIVSSKFYPQIYVQPSFARQRNPRTISSDVLTGTGLPNLNQLFPVFSNDFSALLTASYEVDLWGKVRSASNASYSELLASKEDRRSVLLSIVSSVASSYMLLRQYDVQLKVSRDTLRSREDSYQLAKLRFDEGLTSELEVAQSAADRDEAAIQVVQYETLIPQQENLISVLVGHAPRTINRGCAIDEWMLPPQIPAGLPADLLMQRPDIMSAEERLKAANYRIGEARAQYFPDVTLTGFYGAESPFLHELFSNPYNAWQWAVNLLQPIFTGWRITSEVDLTKAKKDEAVYNYVQTILIALKEVDDALIGHENAKKAVVIEQARVNELSNAFHLATLQYENGLVDYLNVLDAERRLFNAQLLLAQGQAEIFMTLVNIYKALGGGWVINAEDQMQNEWCAHG